MFEKLQAIARLMIIPAVVLYLCGFICMTGYLARFGIVTFDIINARFLIAGLHALLPSSFSIWLSWKVYKSQLDKSVYTYAGSLLRFAIYSELLITPYGAAFGFNALYTTANFSKLSDPDAFHFAPLGGWDIAGRLVSGLRLGFGAQLAFYLCFYGALIIVPIFAAFLACLRRGKAKASQSQTPPATNVQQPQQSPASQPSGLVRYFSNDSIRNRAVILTLDIFAIGLLAAAGIDSWWRIRFELLDADALSNLSFNSNLLLAWFYTTDFSILFFLIALPAGAAQLNFSNFGTWLTPSNAADALYRLAAPVLASLFLFGATVFPRLPVAIGGGMPRQVSLFLKEPDRQFFGGKKFLLGESSQFLFIVQVNGPERRAYQINKDAIEAVETWEDVRPIPKVPKPQPITARPHPPTGGVRP